MERKSILRRTQSLRSISLSSDQPTWTGAGLLGKTISVSQLVARYQTTVEVDATFQETLITPSPLESPETRLEALIWRNEEKERSRTKASLARSKSLGSLQNSAVSIEALKAVFESKAATQNSKPASSFRALTPLHKSPDFKPVMNSEVEEVKKPAEKVKTQMPAEVPVNDAKDEVTQKVVTQTRADRRKTIGGIDFETIAASQADDKRRSIADFRDSSSILTKDKLCVSVKAISALYLSKATPQEPTRLLKQEHDQPVEIGKRAKLTKMAEDSRQKKDDLPPHPSTRHQPEDISGAHFQQSMPSQLSKEKLHQQRQKCELRRLLKHTHPELKMLDDAVDEELAEVLSSETGATTGETGYEGEVLSRRLIFENCAMSDRVSPYIPKRHMAEGMAGKDDVRKTSAVLEERDNRQSSESVKGIAEVPPDPNTQCEETIRIDVQATRRLFESQSPNTSRPITENKFQGKVSICGNETGTVQKQECIKDNPHRENKSNADTKRLDMPHKQQPCAHISQSNDHDFSNWDETGFEDVLTSLPDPEKFEETIKTSAALFKNNPFIQTNIEIEHSFVQTSESRGKAKDSAAAQDNLIANVKDRTHLFESIQFDKIRRQNQDEVETMVENIKETLNSLYGVNVIDSDGSIIEVNETMIAKKARFTLSASGPEIKYDEVAEGGAQNFILQLLPRANLKHQITYLKEDSKGRMEATEVKVPMHQHLNTTNQDSEFKTANVAQVVEDILNQDNSLRKGVIIQEDVNKCAEVIVYSLYNYFDEEDVKSYCPPQGAECDRPEPERGDVSKPEIQELRKGAIKSTINCLLETSRDQTNQGSVRPEITEKGNVRLFRSCIEKGDLEYLKSLQDKATEEEQEVSHNQNVAGQGMELHHEHGNDQAETSEWVPVDVKKLKNMFSGEQKHLECWKSLQNETTVQGQELPLTQNMDGQSSQAETSEWVPVDVKKLKNMFSGDPKPVRPKQNVCTTLAHYTTSPFALTGQDEPLRKSQSSKEPNAKVFFPGQLNNTCIDCNVQTHKEALDLEMQDDGRIHRAELVQAVDENDEISSLQSAIHSLQQATIEAKALHQASQEKRKSLVQESSKEPVALLTDGNVRHSRTKVEIPQDHADKNCQHDNAEICGEDTESDKLQTTEACSTIGQEDTEMVQKSFAVNSSEMTTAQQGDEEVVFEGKLQAALNSLERSNINITRGDFRAAMVYRNSSKPRNERLQNLDTASVQMPIKEESCSVAEPKSTQAPKGQDYSKEVTSATIQAAMEAKGLHQASQVKQKFLAQESSKEPIVSLMDDNMRHLTPEVETPQLNADKKEEKSINVEHQSDFQHEYTKIHGKDTESEMGQEGTEVAQKPVMVSVNSSEITAAQQEDEEVILSGKLQAALNSLEKSNINVTRGDFTAAMIYQNSSKPHNKRPQNLDAASVQRPPKEEFCSVAELKSTQAPKAQDALSATSKKGRRPVGPKPAIPQKPVHLKVNQEKIQSTKINNAETTKTNTLRPEETVHQSLQMTTLSCKDEQHLKVNSNANSEPGVVDLPRNELSDKDMQMSQENERGHQVQGPFVILESNKTDKDINNLQQDINVTADEKSTQGFTIKENMNKSDKRQIDIQQECKKFGGKKVVRNAPVKPKRVKIAQPDKNPKHMSGDHDSSILTHVVDQPQQTLAVPSCENPNTCGQTADKHEGEMKQGVKVEMREKKGRTETEDERRQRLSVHMDEIVRGNITAAMEIFDNLRKQEELQSILSRVEEIEQDTSEVDVRSLRGVFENVPDWVVSSDRKKHKQVKAETKEERMPLTRDNTESKSSMAHVFGDLERASEEIMNLKEQTLARLMDIEGAIKKALYSVSTLKSDADIAGLSCLFKESLGTVQGSPTSGNISKISIGSSRTKSQESPTAQGNTSLPGNQNASTEAVSAKQRASPPSSPAFISIQSAARKTDYTGVLIPETKICPTCQHSPKTEEKFRTTKTLTCNSPAQNRKRDPGKGGQKQPKSKRELSVLEVQTDREGNSIMGTKTVTENYERTDNFGNKFYSSKTSTVVTTQPETTTSTSQAVVSPATHQVTKYPEVRLPISQKP